MKYSFKYKSINFFKDISKSEIIFQSILTGILTGIFVIAFNLSINHLFSFIQNFSNKIPFQNRFLFLPLITMIGGLISGLLVFKIAPETKGSGIPYVKLVLTRLGKKVRIRSLFVKFFAGIAAIGSGLSLGKEGPSVQIGAGVCALVSKIFNIKGTNQYNLITAGSASALGATFNTPISGMIFAVEELTQKFSASMLFPVMISIAVSVSIIRYFVGNYPTFSVPISTTSYVFNIHDIFVFALLGILTGFLGVLFSKNIFFNLKLFSGFSKIPNYIKPAIAGLVIGLIGVFLPEIMGTGSSIVDKLVNSQYTLALILLLFVFKFLATSFCFGSGAAGGIFLPTLLLGALIGGFVAGVTNLFSFDVNTSSLCVIGMGAFLASVVRSPLTAIMMVFEMTGDYTNILPVIFTVAISDLIAEKLNHSPIYTTLILKQNMQSDYAKKLSNIKVCNVCKTFLDSACENMNIDDVYSFMLKNKYSILPIKNLKGKFIGIVSLSDIEDYKIRGNNMMKNIQNVINTEPLTIFQNDDLFKASFLMHINKTDFMIVISRNKKFIGVLYHSDIFNI